MHWPTRFSDSTAGATRPCAPAAWPWWPFLWAAMPGWHWRWLRWYRHRLYPQQPSDLRCDLSDDAHDGDGMTWSLPPVRAGCGALLRHGRSHPLAMSDEPVPTGEKEYWHDKRLGSHRAAASVATPTGPTPPTAPAKTKAKPKSGFLMVVGLVIAVVVVIIAIAVSSGGGARAHFTAKVTSVIALDSHTVRLYILWTNDGKASGSESCILDTTVTNQFGDKVNVEVNSTSTNGNLQPGANQLLHQDIGVNNGDAKFIKPIDVAFNNC